MSKNHQVPLSENESKKQSATKTELKEHLFSLAEANPETIITRNFYRNNSPYSESAWSKFFGTFEEFKRQAGVKLTRHARKMETDVAKHASVESYKDMNTQKRGFEGKYQINNKQRFQTMLNMCDVHDIECDPFSLEVMMDVAKRVQPDKIVVNGDLFDLPEFGKYGVDPREWDVVGRIKWAHGFFERLRKVSPNSEITLIEGNHECNFLDTEILTEKGWVLAENITEDDLVGSYNSGKVTYNKPVAVCLVPNKPIISVDGNLIEERVSSGHNLFIKNKLEKASENIGKHHFSNFTHSWSESKTKYIASVPGLTAEQEVKLLTWAITDGTFVMSSPNKMRVQWKLSRQDKLNHLTELLENIGVPYTFRKATLSAHNKLQPYYITIYGEFARNIIRACGGVKTYPKAWRNSLDETLCKAFLETFLRTDGSLVDRKAHLCTSKKEEADLIQLIFASNGYLTKIKTIENSSGFKEGCTQYQVHVWVSEPNFNLPVIVADTGAYADTIAIQTVDGTLITRRNGKVSVTGNCRLLRHLSEATPAMKAVLSDLHGWTVPKLLGLDQYQVNYVAPADLAVFTDSDIKKELRRNYKVFYDFYVAHHFPEGRNFGLPGFNGHHHTHLVDSHFSPILGTFEWHQFGCMHKRSASYCNGERWGSGFGLTHIDTIGKKAQVEYIDTTSDHCVVGGKWYHRDE